ncbi:TasA family protein [Neobacillus sp. 114]|uniref:TasA family protein n=1 Tax=Neobacillus sp. 114 TaxID=3048535 RepID=UPI0024C382A3|nr:TasA family protein [Neobacillus sp. 114]
MSLKKKLGLGAATAALGLSLIGGGTFAYFNDTSTIHNGFQSGTLVLNVTKAWNFPLNFDLKDVKPGQSWERQFVLKNDGSLDIGNTFMTVTNAGPDSALLDTLKVNYFVDATPPVVDPGAPDAGYLLINSQDVTLREALNGDWAGKIKPQYITPDGKLNLTPLGLAPTADNRFRIQIVFPETGAPQNALQGLTAKVDFHFDARQTNGQHQDQNGPNNGNLVNPDVENH